MRLRNMPGLTPQDLQQESDNGSRFIYYSFTISLLLVTFTRKSGVYLVKKDENPVMKGLFYTIVSGLFGWWGLPNGPRQTLKALRTNLGGGKDVSDDVMATVAGHLLFLEFEQQKAS